MDSLKENPGVPTGTTEIGEPSKLKNRRIVVTKPTLKVVIGQTSLGPRSAANGARADLAKSVQKLMMSNNLKLVNKDGGEITTPTLSQGESREIEISGPEEATLYFMAFEKCSGSRVGTDNFIKKMEDFLLNRNEFYKKVGMNVPEGKEKPLLTPEQQALYNDRMRQYGFSYWQIHLSYTQPESRSVKTRVFKQLNRPDIDAFIKKLKESKESLNSKLTVRKKG